MLIEQVENAYVKFRYYSSLPAWREWSDERKIELAKSAFLWVVRNYDACKFQKEKVLDDIVSVCPEVKKHLLSEDILPVFSKFYWAFSDRGSIVSPEELKWAKKVVADKYCLVKMEELIYLNLLRGSSHWDKIRHEYGWSLNEEQKRKLVLHVFDQDDVGSKRKMELANEFGELKWMFTREYFEKLLWDRHLDKAEKIVAEDEDDAFASLKDFIVLAVIIKNINSLYLRDAIEIAERFLPHDENLISEIKALREVLIK